VIDSRHVALVQAWLQTCNDVVAAAPAVATALTAAGLNARSASPALLPTGSCDAVVLLDDELTRAGDHGEALVAEAAQALAPGGLLIVSVVSRVHAQATGRRLVGRGYTADELRRALGHRGFDVELLCAPGAAATVAGDPDGGLNPELDRSPGLLDAAARLLAIGRRHHDAQGRSAAFFDTLPRKVVAAAALCRDEGRLLVVHDSFKRHWTIPGGVVDPGEDPRSGAQREAFEEAGVEVGVGAVLGVFASSWPERVVLVYDARPLRRSDAAPKPVHAHEIDAVEWLAFDEALARLAPYVAEQVRRCLAEPGGTHWQDHA